METKPLDRAGVSKLGNVRETKVVQLGPGASVRITQLTGAELDWYRSQLFDLNKKNRLEKTREAHSAKLIVLGLINEDGTKMFQRSEWPQVAAWNAALQQVLVDAISEFSGIKEDMEDTFLPGSSDEKDSTE